MSVHNEQHEQHGRHEREHDQVEGSSIQPRPVLMFLAILGAATAFVFVVVKGLDVGLRKIEAENEGQAATQVESQGRKLPPGPQPLLQGAPGRDSTATTDVPTELPLEEMERVRKETNEKANSYGWIDKTAGVARVPVDRAKELIAEKGLPTLPTTTIAEEVRKAEATRKLTLNADSSAGRMIKAQQPVQQPTLQADMQAAAQAAPQPAQGRGRQSQHNQQPAQPLKH